MMERYQIDGVTVTATEHEGIIEYTWGGDIRLYRIPVESYPKHITNVYLILDGDRINLMDTGLDGKKAWGDLEGGLEKVSRHFGPRVTVEDIEGVIISHGHADHWGMLGNPRFKGKRVYIHELDTRVLRDFREVYAGARERIMNFVREAGWEVEAGDFFDLGKLQVRIEEYRLTELTDGSRIINGYEVFHVPGHSPGSVVVRLGPILFVGDHILSNTTPHQLPGSLVEGCGLRLYLASLRKAAALGDLVGLPAHEDIIYPIDTRVEEMLAFHYQRLMDILSLCGTEKTLFQVTDEYYRMRPEYINGKTVPELVRDEQILALEEIRAHIDYLIEEGRLEISGREDGVLRYRTK